MTRDPLPAMHWKGGATLTPDEIRAARKALGLSAAGLAEALLLGANGGRTVRRWEAGETPPSGPVIVALRLMLAAQGIEARSGETA